MASKERAEYETPETKLLKKRRAFYKQKEDFETEKKNFKEHEAINKNKEDKIREQDALIQENLIKFCKHLHDNESDRLKAKQRVQDETKNIEAKVSEMELLKRELELEKRNRARIDEKLTHLKKYDDYLSRVIKIHQNQFNTKDELIQRHDILKASNDKLEKAKEKLELELEETKKQYLLTEKETNDALLTANNSMAELKQLLDSKEQERLSLQDIVEGSKKNTSQETKLIGRIFMTIANLANRCEECNGEIKKARKNQPSGAMQLAAKKKEAAPVQAAAPTALGKEVLPGTGLALVHGDPKSRKSSPGKGNTIIGHAATDGKAVSKVGGLVTVSAADTAAKPSDEQAPEKPNKPKVEEVTVANVEDALKYLFKIFANMKDYRLYKNPNAGGQAKPVRK